MAEHREINELRIKIDELQKTNRSLEQNVVRLTGGKEAANNHIDILTRKNEQLCKELTEIDKMAEQLEEEKEQALSFAEDELEIAKNKIRRKQETIDNLEFTIKNLKTDASISKGHIGNIEAELEERKRENNAMTLLLDQLQVDNSRLSNKVERLEKTEKKRALSEKSKPTSPSKLDAFVKSMEEERNYYKNEVDHLRKMLRSRSLSPKRSPSREPPV